MIRRNWHTVSAMLLVIMIVVWISCTDDPTEPVIVDVGGTLVALHISGGEAPVIDGILDATWDLAAEKSYPLEDDDGELTLVRLKAMVDTTNNDFYMLAVWKDADETIRPDSWFFNPNAFTFGGQDFFCAMFDDGDNGDFGADCYQMCHDVDGDDIGDEMVNPGPSMIDAWFWQAGITNPLSTLEEISYPADSGRRTDDVQLNAAYIKNDDFTGEPRWKHKDSPNHPTDFLHMADTVSFVFESGLDSIPGYALVDPSQFLGASKWDVEAKAVYDNLTGAWVLEIRRSMTTGNVDDVQFIRGQLVNCTVAVASNLNFNNPYPHFGSEEFQIQL